MAITRVKDTTPNHGASFTTLAVSFATLPAAGNCVIVEVNQSAATSNPFLAGQVTDKRAERQWQVHRDGRHRDRGACLVGVLCAAQL